MTDRSGDVPEHSNPFHEAPMYLDPPRQLPYEVSELAVERFPRQMLFEFADDHTDPTLPTTRIRLLDARPNAFPNGPIKHYGRTQGFRLGAQIGNDIDDNIYIPDGFRFHDALHISAATMTGWSAVLRNLLHLKRRSLPDIDRIQDGRRAIQAEEQLFTQLGIGTIQGEDAYFADLTLYAAIQTTRGTIDKLLPEGTFIGAREWEKALKVGFNVVQLLKSTIGVVDPGDTKTTKCAYVHADLDHKAIRFSTKDPEGILDTEPIQPINPLWLD